MALIDEKQERFNKAVGIARDMLDECRVQLMLKFRFLDLALWRMNAKALDVSGRYALATDGESIFFEPYATLLRFDESFNELVRDYLHLVMHCIYRHPFDENHDRHNAWWLVCDIMAESTALDLCAGRFESELDQSRKTALSELRLMCGKLTPNRLYALFKAAEIAPRGQVYQGLSQSRLNELAALFERDNHEAWPSYAKQKSDEKPGEVQELAEQDDSSDEEASSDADSDALLDGETVPSEEEKRGEQQQARKDQTQQQAQTDCKQTGEQADEQQVGESKQSDAQQSDAQQSDEQQQSRNAQDSQKSQRDEASSGSSQAEEQGVANSKSQAQNGQNNASQHRFQAEASELREPCDNTTVYGDLDSMPHEAEQVAEYEELERAWEEIAKQVEMNLETFAKEWGEAAGSLIASLKVANRKKYDYGNFLKQFAALSEEMKINDDEYDYVFYTYGLERYGNMPLIEPLEYKETQRIRDFVIAIDTSESCKGALIRKFIEYTFDIMKHEEDFAHKLNVHVLQCDAKVQADTKITNLRDIDALMEHFYIRGLGGTDFRPVFSYVEDLRYEGELQGLKGLIYFTDGLGRFPEKAPDYDTAFVFIDTGEDNLPKVPPWAIKLVLDEEELGRLGKRQ